MNKNCSPPQNKLHSAELCLSFVLKNFWRNSQKTFFLDVKVTISESSTEILRKFVFLNMLESGKSGGK